MESLEMVTFAFCVLLRASYVLWTVGASDPVGGAVCQSAEATESAGPIDWQPADMRKGLTQTELLSSNAWTTLHFGVAPLQVSLPRYLKLHNPADRLARVQAFLILEPETLDRKYQQLLPDEDEIFTVPETAEQPSDSMRAIHEASSRLPPVSFRQPNDQTLLERLFLALGRHQATDLTKLQTNMLPKYVCKRDCRWVPTDPNAYELMSNLSQAFYLSPEAQGVFYLPPGGCMHLGPIVFHPSGIGHYHAILLIRLKYSKSDAILHRVELTGEGQYARLAFQASTIYRRSGQFDSHVRSQEYSSLEFNVTQEDLLDQMTVQNRQVSLPQTVTFTRRFEAQNVGSMPLFLTGVSLDGQGCTRFGIHIHDCETPRLVQPQGVVFWNVSYTPEFVETDVHTQLWMHATEAFFYIPLEVSLVLLDLTRLSEWRSVDVHSWTHLAADTALLLQTILATGCLLAIGKDAIWPPQQTTVKVQSSREQVNHLALPPMQELTRSPHLSPVPAPVQPLTVCHVQSSSLPPLLTLPVEDPSIKREVNKTRKVKKLKASILKFAPTAPQTTDNGDSGTVFATKQPYVKRIRCKSEAEDQGSESFTTTHTEEELEDVYLDDFKNRQGLFNGFSFA